ncbi:NADH dehydrogenase [ubiquinone] 1 alpha subcomplex subunit 2 isoform X2 [Dryobates pubescens]|uniref:NADH dehydrogenase [ubiquinone] 1 alpha subcomplex subunit 2 isoform X2 n=1 Tax=Dryobates pubescens TaxID=118200 RepID=UPI0023B9666D|nr:NADH dehydrogenase [ubiquinone] 1 alpha subcomplex subunit 2 isoform X2 [Dryobates pubescens]
MAAAAVRGIGGGLGRGLRELRIHLCQRSPGSRGVREFIEQHYVTLKKANPDFPILIRECSGVQPKLWARYEDQGTSLTLCLPCRVWQGEERVPEQPLGG